MGCSQIYSKPFIIRDWKIQLNQKLKIKNILGQELEIWLCNTQDKIIVISIINLQGSYNIKIASQNDILAQVQLKLNNITFAKLNLNLMYILFKSHRINKR